MTDDVFEDLVNLYLDKEIKPAQLQILRDELGRSEGRQKTFESYCRMHQATHFAALSRHPVIPRITRQFSSRNRKPGLFRTSKPAWAAAILVAVMGTFTTLYFKGPFGSARITHSNKESLQKIETFAQDIPEAVQPPLEFFRALKIQNQNQDWSYVQELRHIRANKEIQGNQDSTLYTWSDLQRNQERDNPSSHGFEIEYSNYEFKR